MKIILKPLKKTYLEFLRKTRTNPEINKYLFTDIRSNKRKQEEWYKNIYLKDKNFLILIAFYNKTPVGYGQITHINSINRSCEVGFRIVPDLQGRGYGKALIDQIINYAARKLKMHRICLEVFENNYRAINLYKKRGFKKEAVLRDKIFKGGKFHNVIIMSILV